MNSYNDDIRNLISHLIKAQQRNILELSNLKSKVCNGTESELESKGTIVNTGLDDNPIVEPSTKHGLIDSFKNLKYWTKALHENTSKSLSLASNLAAKSQFNANSVSKLTETVHKTYAIINALGIDYKLHTHAKSVNYLIKETANIVEEVSKQNLKIDEGIAKLEVAKIITGVETAIHDLKFISKKTVSEFDNSKKNFQLITAKLSAAKKVKQRINMNLNLNLSSNIELDSSNRISLNISFNPILHPFNSNIADPESNIVESYYLMILRDKDSKTFAIDQAERLIVRTAHEKGYFLVPKNEIKPGTQTQIELIEPVDIESNDLDINSTYKFYLFAELKSTFKRECGDFEDFLSAPAYIDSEHPKERKSTPFQLENIHSLNSTYLNEPSCESTIKRLTEVKEKTSESQKEIINITEKINSSITTQNNQIRKLIFALQSLDKLSDLIIRRKAMNSLIPNELIELVTVSKTESMSGFTSILSTLESSCELLHSALLSHEILSITTTEIANLQKELKRLYN